jgi:hypothetical protein
MRSGEMHERLSALERRADNEREHRLDVNERIDTLRGVVLGILLALRATDPKMCDPLVRALRTFEREARRLKVYDVSVADLGELIETLETLETCWSWSGTRQSL